MSGSFPAARSSRLHTPFASERELRIGKYLVDRALFHAGAASAAFEKLVRQKCFQFGFEPGSADSAERERMTHAIAMRIVPYIRAALRKERRNRETIFFELDDTLIF